MQSQVSNHSQMPTGYPAPFDPEIGARCCELAADGKLLPEIAKEIGLSTTTIAKWRALNPIFERAFTTARDAGIDVLVDTLSDISTNTPDVHRARLICDNIKWIAERRKRRVYGASIDMSITQVPELAGTLIEARRRALPVRDQTALPEPQDVEYITVSSAGASDTESPAAGSTPNPFD